MEATTIHHDANLVDVTLKVSTPTPSSSAKTAAPAGKTSAQTAAAPAKSATMTTHTEVVHTTANHPWLSADHGWLIASFLQVGEPVRQADGSTATVVAVRSVPGAADMWDLTISNLHDFAVGSGAFVVFRLRQGNFDRQRSARIRYTDEYDDTTPRPPPDGAAHGGCDRQHSRICQRA